MRKNEKDPFDPKKKDAQAETAGDPAGDAKQDQEKDSEQEDSNPGQDDSEEQGVDQPQEEEQPEKKEQAPEEDPTVEKDSPVDAEKEQLKADLLAARCQIAAYASGVAPEMVADAVTLATAEAQAAGEVTEEAVTKAMDNVIKRHPEWKSKPAAVGAKKTTGGFKLGADPDSSGRSKDTSKEKGAKKPWNKFNR